MTKAERAIRVAEVAKLQNHWANVTQDHMTITGFFDTDAEFDRHIEKLQDRADRNDAKHEIVFGKQ